MNIKNKLLKLVENTEKIIIPKKLGELNISQGLKNKASDKTVR
jgi:hypothetical protein